MKRISLFGASAMLGASLMAAMGGGSHVFEIDRDRPVSNKRRRIAKHKQPAGRSRYMPHYGAKEQERAKRCYMHYTFSTADSFHHPLRLRSAPVMHQRSKLVQEFHDAGISWF